MTLFGEPRGRPGPPAQGAWRGHIGIKPGRIYPRSPPDQSSDLPTTKDDIPNLLYHGSRGFYIGPVSSLGCGAAPGGLPLLAISQAGDALIEMIARTANGRLTAAEALGHREFVLTKLYRSA
jgi:hypothetical protein